MPGKKRKKEEIITLLNRVSSGERVEDVCCEIGVSVGIYFRWKSKYGCMSKAELAKTKQLEAENARLKRLLTERDLEVDSLKEILQKKW